MRREHTVPNFENSLLPRRRTNGKENPKAGATAKFGARYGVSVRRNSGKLMAKKRHCTHARYANTRKSRDNLLEFGPVRWSHFCWWCLGALH